MEQVIDLLEYFPLESVANFVTLCKYEVSKSNPKLSVISIVLGWFEQKLTNENSQSVNERQNFPELHWDEFSMLWLEFARLAHELKHLLDEKAEDVAVKIVADFVWSKLSKAFFKDKQHIQTVYSFMKGKQLDCFGIAITTLSFLQHIGFNDIHLSLSEDHAWLHYGNNDTAEVTWHGKGNEQKRGKPIQFGCDVDVSKNWLYLGNHPIKCSRPMEVCAIINAINPGINSKTDSEIIGQIQQELLWCMYNQGHLSKFPVAICNLADLEEIEPSNGRAKSVQELYEEAIRCVIEDYGSYHVYPYTYFAGYLYRSRRLEEAIMVWSRAAEVISRYDYSKEDEEIYKEFAEITNVFLTEAVRGKEFKTLHNKPEIFIALIKYFDFLCQWENGSKTQVFHEQWAKSFLKIFSAIDADQRIRYSIEFKAALRSESVGTTGHSKPANELLQHEMAKETMQQKATKETFFQEPLDVGKRELIAEILLESSDCTVISHEASAENNLQREAIASETSLQKSITKTLEVASNQSGEVLDDISKITASDILSGELTDEIRQGFSATEPSRGEIVERETIQKTVQETTNKALKQESKSLLTSSSPLTPQLTKIIFSSKMTEILTLFQKGKINAAAVRLTLCRQAGGLNDDEKCAGEKASEGNSRKRRKIR